MRLFRCDHCDNALYFENSACLRCGSALAFLPGEMDLCAIEPVPGDPGGLWRRRAPAPSPGGGHWRRCQHLQDAAACNFAIPGDDPSSLCAACRLTRVLPDLSDPANAAGWGRIEMAKRRLFFSLARLRLLDPAPAGGRSDGPAFEFRRALPGQPVHTGHGGGVITLDVAEADDAERARRRTALRETYRTLLGHLRHESGHYYWDRLIEAGGRHEAFRHVFGDERADYAQALQRHYASGAPAAWDQGYVSAYATAHPWEDWAETWAHYLHMTDLLETAASFGTRVSALGGSGDPGVAPSPAADTPPFDDLVAQWIPLTLLVNSLNRSLGQEDAYPFALSDAALAKLRFVHHLISERPGPA